MEMKRTLLSDQEFPGFQRGPIAANTGKTKSTTVRRQTTSHAVDQSTCVPTRSGVREDHTASYFSHNNVEAARIREQLAAESLEMLISWLKDGGNVGIHGTSKLYTCG
jgi:hypothetical protein